MGIIDSAEAQKELGRIDKILSDKHLLIGGLAVKFYYPARESKDIDLVCSDKVRNQIIKELYPSNEWDIFDENMNEYRPDYHIKNKKNKLTISFGPKIKERDPYKNIDWELLLKEQSIPFQAYKTTFNNIYIPNASALAYTKFISFIDRQNNKDIQDLQDFIDLTNNKQCSLDILFNLIDNIYDSQKLNDDFFDKIYSKREYENIISNGNIFKFANFFHEKKRTESNHHFSDLVNVTPSDTLENKPIMFFSQNDRPPETQIFEAIKDTKKFYFMAKTGADFFSNYSSHIKDAMDNGCHCKFIIVNQYSPAIEYGKSEANNLENIQSAYFYLRDFKTYNEEKVEIRVLNYYPNFDFEYFEKKDGRKIIIVRNNFLFSHLGINRPMFMLQEEDYWYSVFLKEFELAWEKAQVWGKTIRIVIDGAPGSGKTTLLTGISQRDDSKKKFKSIKDAGYTIFEELIYGVAAYMRKEGLGELYENWDLFFDLVIDRAIDFYKAAKPNLINFYDRGIFFLEILAERYDRTLPEKYYDFIKENKYDNPIFILHPILDVDMTKPHWTDHKYKVYTKEERMKQHRKIIELYKRNGYEVIEIPLLHDSVKVNTKLRLSEINKNLGIL